MLILDVLSPLLLLSILLPGYGCRAADIPEDTTSEFSVRLYQRLQAAGGQDNIIFSPLSVAVALGMVELGARGASLEEIRQAVGFSHLLPGETCLLAAVHTHVKVRSKWVEMSLWHNKCKCISLHKRSRIQGLSFSYTPLYTWTIETVIYCISIAMVQK